MKLRCRLLVVLVALVAGTGCGLKTAYNYSDWLALWWVDHYFDLTHEQKASLSERFEALLVRHRNEALPAYARFISDVQAKVRVGLSGADVDWVYGSYEDLRTEFFERVVNDGAGFLASVDERQIEYLEQAIREDNERFEERLREDSDKRLVKRAADTVDWIEDWVGDLSAEQERRITELSLAVPDTLEAWLEYRRSRQEVFVRLLRASKDRSEIEGPLREWLVYPEKGASAGYLRSRDAMRQASKGMVLSVDDMLTDAQRDHLVEELGDVIDALHELSES